jgi:hypothetical protein
MLKRVVRTAKPHHIQVGIRLVVAQTMNFNVQRPANPARFRNQFTASYGRPGSPPKPAFVLVVWILTTWSGIYHKQVT